MSYFLAIALLSIITKKEHPPGYSLVGFYHEIWLHLQVALNHALSNVFLLAAIVMAIAGLLTFAIKEVPLRSQKETLKVEE